MERINKKILLFFLNNKWTFFKGFFSGTFGLSLFYYLLLLIVTKDFSHPIQQFLLFQPWMTILIVGFGLQIGFHLLLKHGKCCNQEEETDSQLATGANTVLSGTAMVACCAHHLVDVLPLLGLSSTFMFFSEYQKEILIIGVIMNILGTLLMLILLLKKLELTELQKIFKTGENL